MDITSGEKNPRGVPGCKFLEDIGAFVREHSTTTEDIIGALHTLHSKYKTMELHLLENRKRIQMKLPDLEKSLEVVKMLQAKKEAAETLSTRFNLSDNVYAQAKVEPDDRVCVWLGADVMLEYSYTEAEEMLTKRVADAKAKDAEIVEDLAWVRENKIIAEVNTSRTFNYDVRRRRAAGGSDGDAAAPKTVAVDA